MGKFTYKTAAFVLGALVLPSLSLAAGLGQLTVLSALGQPLRAEIEIVSLQPGEGESLTARLASQDAFRQANIELQSALLSARFAVERRPSGQFFVVLTSSELMNEPFIDVLVELNWASGRLVREYTFLLDPPEYRGPAVAAPSVSQPAAQAQALPAPKRPEVQASAPAPAPAPAAKSAGTYEVKRGDTLSKIANQHAVQGITLQQMLVALYRGNQDAFDGNNMNRLRAGKILNLPNKDTVSSVSEEEASRLVASQGSEFAQYRRSLGAAVAAAPAKAEAGRQVSGKIATPSEQKAAPAKPAQKDQLRLTKAEDAKSGGRAGAAAAGDDRSAKDKALKEANERVAALEKNVQDLQKLVQMKSEAGAKLQESAKPAAKSPEPAKAAPAPAAKAEPAKAAPAAEPAKAAEAGSADAAKAPAPAAPPKVTAPPPPPPPPPSFVDEFLDNPAAMGGAGLVVVLLAGYAVYALRKKRKEQFESSVLGAAPATSSVLGASGGRSVDTSASTPSFQSDFSQEGIGKADTEEIDPVAEADVYMAYGRDAQAEEILKEALGKDPNRQAIRLKLVEIYANRKDLKALETTAGELYAATNGQGPDWEKAAGLGLSVDPENPLYGGKKAEGDQTLASTQVLPGAAVAAAAETEEATVVAEAPAPAATEEQTIAGGALDFDLDLGAAPAAAAAPEAAAETAAAPAGLDFDLGLDTGGEKKEDATLAEFSTASTVIFDSDTRAAAQAASSAGGGLSMDFELPADDATVVTPAGAPPAAPPAAESAGLDFDLGAGSTVTPAPGTDPDLTEISLDLGVPIGETTAAAPVDAKWQEVATKLDLAKAYEEMGDKDGARELLNEVLKEGDTAQQQQARKILESVG